MEERWKNHGEEEAQQRLEKLHDNVIVHQILPWMPIKPLTQYKVVSKQWYSSLTSHNFILNYVKQPLFIHPCPPIETLLIKCGRSYYLYSCVSDDNVPNYHQTNNELVRVNVVEGNDRIFVGCSNGLVCLADSNGRYFILWNPTTKQSHKYYSPDFKDLKFVSSMDVSFSWGMGYVSSLDDHKVVRVATHLHVPCGFSDSVHVFSLRSNSWKEIEIDVDNWLLLSAPRLANETLYWAKTNKTSEGKVYVSFDLASETFREFPHFSVSRWSSVNKLCVMGGCISKCSRNSQNELVVDILKQPGRVASVCLRSELIQQDPCDLIGFTKTGKIVVAYTCPSRLCLVDVNSTRHLVTFEDQGITCIERYVPSQVSPLPPVNNSALKSLTPN